MEFRFYYKKKTTLEIFQLRNKMAWFYFFNRSFKLLHGEISEGEQRENNQKVRRLIQPREELKMVFKDNV